MKVKNDSSGVALGLRNSAIVGVFHQQSHAIDIANLLVVYKSIKAKLNLRKYVPGMREDIGGKHQQQHTESD